MRFPLVGSAVLLGLFTAIKLLPASMISLVVGWYFVLLGTFAIAASVLPFFPFGNSRGFLKLGFLNGLPKIVKLFLFEAEDVGALEVTLAELLCGLGSFGFCCWYHASRHWVSNNVIGIGFCVQVSLQTSPAFLTHTHIRGREPRILLTRSLTRSLAHSLGRSLVSRPQKGRKTTQNDGKRKQSS